MINLDPLREDLARLKEVDRILVGSAFALFAIGVISVYSALAGRGELAVSLAVRQIVWGIMGAMAFLATFAAGFERMLKYCYWLYGAALFTLLVLLVFGHTAKGATSWFDFGAFRFQPSEPTKVALSLVLAVFLCRYPPKSIVNILGVAMVSSLAAILVLLQPDLGGVIVYAFMIFVALIVAGAPRRYILMLTVIFLLSLTLGWSMLKEYQKLRIMVFFDPYIDPLGAGYNVIQSRIAVGSGGLLGRGSWEDPRPSFIFCRKPIRTLFSAFFQRSSASWEHHWSFSFLQFCCGGLSGRRPGQPMKEGKYLLPLSRPGYGSRPL